MSADDPQPGGEQQPGPPGEPSEEELRAAYEAELSRLTSADLIAQAVVSLLNVGVRRLGPPHGAGAPQDAAAQGGAAPERDLEQVRDSIDAVRALLEILERRVPEGLRPLRDALSQLQMAYAREVQSGAAGPGAGTPAGETGQAGDAGGSQAPGSEQDPGEPGPAQRSGRLWVPGT